MKDLNLLVWLTQLGMSIAMPLAGFTMLGIWLRAKYSLGIWAVLCGCAIGMICAIDGFRQSLRLMDNENKKKGDKEPPPVSFNDHD